jgi:hypothetical protein
MNVSSALSYSDDDDDSAFARRSPKRSPSMENVAKQSRET